MIVDIQPQWKKLANWYWDNSTVGMSIWEMLEHNYGAIRSVPARKGYLVEFPDEKSYTAFLLKWS